MLKEIFNRKMIGLIMQQKMLRVALMLSATMIIIISILISTNYSFAKKSESNDSQIQDIKIQLGELEKIVSEEEKEADSRIEGRTFASYDEIVPFINLLESLFGIIDKESKILVRDNENQILMNRYADYEIKVKPGDKMDLFLKALSELYKSKYITKVTSFVINYMPIEGGSNEIDEINITIRLYFE